MASYSSITSTETNNIVWHKYVQLDTSINRDCYNLPVNAEVVYAVDEISREDYTRKLIPPWKKGDPIWRIDTEKIEIYENIEVLKYFEESIASVEIKKEKLTIDDKGKLVRQNTRQMDNDLYITLPKANTDTFKNISNEELNRMIVNIGVGNIKIAVAPQMHKNSKIPNGNKFCVLKNVKKSDLPKIPEAFYFADKDYGPLRMWINYDGKPGKC